jgi:hypothetical protein
MILNKHIYYIIIIIIFIQMILNQNFIIIIHLI